MLINSLYTHFRPHFEEICAMVVFWILGKNKFQGAEKAVHHYILNQYNVPGDAKESIFLGTGNAMLDDLLAAGVSKSQVLDEHIKNGRTFDSSFRMLIGALGLENDSKLCVWADALGMQDSGQSTDSFTIYKTLNAMYAMEEGGCKYTVKWAEDLFRAAFSCDKYFEKGPRTVQAGKLFEFFAGTWLVKKFSGGQQKNCNLQESLRVWNERKRTFCAAADYVSQRNNPCLREIGRMTNNNCQSASGVLGLPRLIYALYEKEGLEAAYKSACRALEATFQKQNRFLLACEEARDPKGQFPLKNGRFVFFSFSGNPEMNAAARYVHGNKVAAVFTADTKVKGNVQIYANGKSGTSLTKTNQAILEAEAKHNGEQPPEKMWYYLATGDNGNRGAEMLLNGSLSYPDVPASKISVDQWEEIFKKTL